MSSPKMNTSPSFLRTLGQFVVFKNNLLKLHLFLCMSVNVCAHLCHGLLEAMDDFGELVFSPYRMFPWDQPRVVRLDHEPHCVPSHVSGSRAMVPG